MQAIPHGKGWRLLLIRPVIDSHDLHRNLRMACAPIGGAGHTLLSAEAALRLALRAAVC